MKTNTAVLSLLLFMPHHSYACSFSEGYTSFYAAPQLTLRSKPPEKPNLEVSYIKRGFDDGDGGSCSDAGIIILRVLDDNPKFATGYKFEVVDGSFEDSLFPESFITQPTRPLVHGDFMFVWFDGPRNIQESIDLRVKATAMNLQGIESEPFVFQIYHPGGKSR